MKKTEILKIANSCYKTVVTSCCSLYEGKNNLKIQPGITSSLVASLSLVIIFLVVIKNQLYKEANSMLRCSVEKTSATGYTKPL